MSEAVQFQQVNPVEQSYPEFASTWLNIKTKAGGVTKFHLNVIQLEIDRVIEEQIAAGRPVRLIILKARQEGVSTYSLGRMYHYTTTHENVDALMAAHDEESSEDLFERLRLMYDLADERPMTRYSSKQVLHFANPNRKKARFEPGLQSTCRVGTAGRKNLGRSKTLRYLHLSEVAFWDKADTVLLGLEQALPKGPGTIEIIESTANGVGGEFHKRWLRACDPNQRGDWIPLFFGWWQFPEYEMELVDGEMFPIPSSVEDVEAFLNEERQLRKAHGCTDRQLNWRRWTIVNDCGNSVEKFRQEYPANPDEAFLTSGRPVFNQQRVLARKNKLEATDALIRQNGGKPRYLRGFIRTVDGRRLKWKPSVDGNCRVYEWPRPHREYLITADVAEGLAIGDDPDESVAHVFDVLTWKQLFVVQCRMTPAEFARLLRLLGYYYNTALIAAEVNNHGHTVNNKLEELRYPRIYMRQDTEKLGNQTITKYGWRTDVKTRPQLVDSFIEAVDGNLVELNDVPTLEQMFRFIHNPKKGGRPEGAEGCHDDLVIAGGIAMWVLRYGHVRKQTARQLKVKELPAEQAMVAKELDKLKAAYKARRRQAYGQGRVSRV